MSANRIRLAAIGTIAGLLAGALVKSFMPSESSANHPKGPSHDHLGSINSFEPDDFCVWIEEDGQGNPLSSMDWATAVSRISSTVDAAGPDTEDDWHRLDGSDNGNKLLFTPDTAMPCDDYASRSLIEMEYWVRDDTSSTPCGGYSCAFPFGHQYDDPVSGHLEWSGYAVRFKTSHINQADPEEGQPKPWWHVINHETGHMLGLDDPPPCSSEGISEDSVMHSNYYYGCAEDKNWPTLDDRNSVLALIGAPPTSPPSGNFSLNKAW